MKSTLSRVVIGMILFAIGGARTPALARNSVAADKAEITRLEQRWAGAIKTGDRRALEPILANDFIDVNTQGQFRSKADVIAYSTSPADTTQTVRELNVRVWGDTAVVTGIKQMHSITQGWIIELPFTDVFARIHGRWRAVSAQETLLRPQRALH